MLVLGDDERHREGQRPGATHCLPARVVDEAQSPGARAPGDEQNCRDQGHDRPHDGASPGCARPRLRRGWRPIRHSGTQSKPGAVRTKRATRAMRRRATPHFTGTACRASPASGVSVSTAGSPASRTNARHARADRAPGSSQRRWRTRNFCESGRTTRAADDRRGGYERSQADSKAAPEAFRLPGAALRGQSRAASLSSGEYEQFPCP